jgi:hypothetical protein
MNVWEQLLEHFPPVPCNDAPRGNEDEELEELSKRTAQIFGRIKKRADRLESPKQTTELWFPPGHLCASLSIAQGTNTIPRILTPTEHTETLEITRQLKRQLNTPTPQGRPRRECGIVTAGMVDAEPIDDWCIRLGQAKGEHPMREWKHGSKAMPGPSPIPWGFPGMNEEILELAPHMPESHRAMRLYFLDLTAITNMSWKDLLAMESKLQDEKRSTAQSRLYIYGLRKRILENQEKWIMSLESRSEEDCALDKARLVDVRQKLQNLRVPRKWDKPWD